VNRKQRRTAAKLGEQVLPAVWQNGIISPSGHIADQLARGRRHYQAGQFPEAENCYRKVLAIDPNHFEVSLGATGHVRKAGIITYEQPSKFDMAMDVKTASALA
jgi:tetratricopeptide (TPR) repeat protein